MRQGLTAGYRRSALFKTFDSKRTIDYGLAIVNPNAPTALNGLCQVRTIHESDSHFGKRLLKLWNCKYCKDI